MQFILMNNTSPFGFHVSLKSHIRVPPLAETFTDYFVNVVSNLGINILDIGLVKVMFLITIITQA